MSRKLNTIFSTTIMMLIAWFLSVLFIYKHRVLDSLQTIDMIFLAIWAGLVISIVIKDYNQHEEKRTQKSLKNSHITIPSEAEYQSKLSTTHVEMVKPLNLFMSSSNAKTSHSNGLHMSRREYHISKGIFFYVTTPQKELLYKVTSDPYKKDVCNVSDPYDNLLGTFISSYNTLPGKGIFVSKAELPGGGGFSVKVEDSTEKVANTLKGIVSGKGLIDSMLDYNTSTYYLEGLPVTCRMACKNNVILLQVLSEHDELLAECGISKKSYGINKDKVYDMVFYSPSYHLEICLIWIIIQVAETYSKVED